jgi:hypothetical protein
MGGGWTKNTPGKPMSPIITSKDWAIAYAVQAQSDWVAREHLMLYPSLPRCHALHFLQMACEKLCKSYLLTKGSKPEEIRHSHAYISKILPTILRGWLTKSTTVGNKDRSIILAKGGEFAREIELLAPAVKAGGRRDDNCEYPWDDQQKHLHIPAEEDFRNLQFLDKSFGTTFLKVIQTVINDHIAEIR